MSGFSGALAQTSCSRGSKHLALAVFAALVLAESPASAQDRLYTHLTLSELGTAGRFGEAIGPFPADLQRQLVGGGRFSVGFGDVLDRRTGRRITFSGLPVAYDRARPRVFVIVSSPVAGVAVLDIERGTTTLLVAASGLREFPPPALYAADANLLFVLEGHSAAGLDYVAVTPDDGAVVRRLRLPATIEAVTPDATRVFTAGFFDPVGSRVFDGVTGASIGQAPYGRLEWIDALDLLFSTGGAQPGLYDRNLRPVASIPEVDGKCPTRLTVSPHTDVAYLFTGGGDFYGSVTDAVMTAIDLSGRTAPRRVNLSQTLALGRSACVYPVLTTAPGPPRDLTARVEGRDVALTWRNVGAASHFVLDVGLAPGRTDLSVPLGVEPRAAFSGVPPGVYYLRVRGGNEFGGGRASDERRIIVP